MACLKPSADGELPSPCGKLPLLLRTQPENSASCRDTPTPLQLPPARYSEVMGCWGPTMMTKMTDTRIPEMSLSLSELQFPHAKLGANLNLVLQRWRQRAGRELQGLVVRKGAV